jgi:FMN-dependent NADH-azoreductase
VADAFVEEYRRSRPDDEVMTRNLFTMALPPFDGFALQAKYRILHGQPHSPEEKTAWQAVSALAEEFKAADRIALAVPMWNFHFPYRLKHYLDVIIQPGLTFSFSPEAGYTGLVTGRPVFIAYARGGAYPTGSPAESFDFQTKHLEFLLGFIGLNDIRRVVVEPTLAGGPEEALRLRAEGMARAREIARSF